MGNSNIEKLSKIKKEKLNKSQYTLSLLSEACNAGVLTKTQVQGIQGQIMNTLSDLIMKYTSGESSSVKTETAQNLLLSLLYAMDSYLVGLDDPMYSLSLLQNAGVDDAYKKGLEIVQFFVSEAQALLAKVKIDKLNVELQAYNDSIDKALPNFFYSYDAQFYAHETMAAIDYPLAFDDMSMTGILYIKQYLEKLEIENEFCRMFCQSDIDRLLENYGKIYHTDYRELLINLFEIVLSNCVFTVLLGSNAKTILISKEQGQLLLEKLSEQSKSDCYNEVGKAIDTIIIELGITEPKTQAYMKKNIGVLSENIVRAVTQNSLHNLVVTVQEETNEPKAIFKDGTKMSDENLRSVIKRIVESEDAKEKARMIISSAHCFDDFIDILGAHCLFDDEYYAVFDLLGEIETALLIVRVYEEEPISYSEGFSMNEIMDSQYESEWKNRFVYFLNGLSEKSLKIIETFVNRLLTP